VAGGTSLPHWWWLQLQNDTFHQILCRFLAFLDAGT
jgi:hypothetical protein